MWEIGSFELTFHNREKTVSIYFNQVLYAIGELLGELIQPLKITTSPIIKQDPKFIPYFKERNLELTLVKFFY